MTLRDNTERPETVDVGANLIAGTDERIIQSTRKMLESSFGWENPYGNGDAAELLLKELLDGAINN